MMGQPAKLFVSASASDAWIRICGRANFATSPDFKHLVSELRATGHTHIVLDLTECALMDSTFLGVLAGFGSRLGADAVELSCPNARIIELLENLGVSHLFKITHCGQPATPPAEESPAAPHTPSEFAQTSLEAHHALMEIEPKNIPKFKDVTQFLAEDLQRLKTQLK